MCMSWNKSSNINNMHGATIKIREVTPTVWWNNLQTNHHGSQRTKFLCCNLNSLPPYLQNIARMCSTLVFYSGNPDFKPWSQNWLSLLWFFMYYSGSPGKYRISIPKLGRNACFLIFCTSVSTGHFVTEHFAVSRIASVDKRSRN